VYAFCAGQKFDASTISGLIIILYPVAKWILVKVFLKKYKLDGLKWLKNLFLWNNWTIKKRGNWQEYSQN
jgi:hypothetical protein